MTHHDASGFSSFAGARTDAQWTYRPPSRATSAAFDSTIDVMLAVIEPKTSALLAERRLPGAIGFGPRDSRRSVPTKPELVQFGALTPAHFARHPVWISCHIADYDEPWYDETDEETFRPRTGPMPAEATEGMLLARADFVLADGSRLAGFLSPGSKAIRRSFWA